MYAIIQEEVVIRLDQHRDFLEVFLGNLSVDCCLPSSYCSPFSSCIPPLFSAICQTSYLLVEYTISCLLHCPLSTYSLRPISYSTFPLFLVSPSCTI